MKFENFIEKHFMSKKLFKKAIEGQTKITMELNNGNVSLETNGSHLSLILCISILINDLIENQYKKMDLEKIKNEIKKIKEEQDFLKDLNLENIIKEEDLIKMKLLSNNIDLIQQFVLNLKYSTINTRTSFDTKEEMDIFKMMMDIDNETLEKIKSQIDKERK